MLNRRTTVVLIVVFVVSAVWVPATPAQVSVNLPPSANFSVSCRQLECTFTDTSVDLDGAVTVWFWAFGDGTSSVLPDPTHTFEGAGNYTVGLTVQDEDGGSGSTQRLVSVTDTVFNQTPIPEFRHECAGMTCTFTDQSVDLDGSIVSWEWRFGDSSSSQAQSPSHTYVSRDTFQVSLRVTDDGGGATEITRLIAVTGAPLRHERHVQLTKVKDLLATGKVLSEFVPCSSGVSVKFQRKSGNTWKAAKGKGVSYATTSLDGGFEFQLAGDNKAARGKKFRAVVQEESPAGLTDHQCAAAQSKPRTN